MNRRGLRRAPAALVSGALVVLASAGLVASAQAAGTYTVGTTSDLTGICANPAAGSCSLRQLIEYEDSLPPASEPDAIVVPAGKYDLSNGELFITQSLAIVGAGARSTHLDVTGAPARVLNIQAANGGEPTVVISGLEISGGTANESNGSFGGDVYNKGNLVLTEDWITEGKASSGGGISNDTGELFVLRSLVSENSANTGGGDSGAIQNHGSAVTKATLDVEDSTIAENNARLGAGIFSWSDEPVGNAVSIVNSTIAENDVTVETSGNPRGPGAGLLIGDGTAQVVGSIIAFNRETFEGFTNTNCSTLGSGTIVSLGYNLESATDCGFTATGDKQETVPQFVEGDLQDNGGNTDTLALEPTSPGVDVIPTSFPFCSGADQRGAPRPLGSGCDIGAVEAVPFTIEAVAASSFSGKVAAASTCSYESTPTIDWGDGQNSEATTTEAGIDGVHTYAKEGTYNGLVSYSTDCGFRTIAFLARVADAPLSATGVPVSATAGVPLTATVASFTDADPTGVASDYTAAINWGDGTVTAGTIGAAAGGGFAVSGSHTYANGAVYPVSVTIQDTGGSTATATSSATVANPPPGLPTVLTVAPPSVITTTSATFTTTVNPHGLATLVHFEYGPVLGGAKTAAITYGSVTPDQPAGADYANHTVTATVTGLLPNVTYHVRAVATNGAGATQGADQTLKTPADAPPPPPVLGKAVNVTPVSGVVYIQLPPGAKLAALSSGVPSEPAFTALTKGTGFIPLTEARQIPVGSILDTSAGVARIATATAQKGKTQFGNFGAGLFKLLQQRKQRGLTEMDIINTHTVRNACATVGKKASIAKRLSSKTLGRLTGNAHGKFTTRGQYSAATVRGTIWQVTNRCDGTLTHVTRDIVTVRDFHRRKTITLLSGQSYLAKAPR